MPESNSFGPNEAVWRDFSAKCVRIALTWPDEKLLRFTAHENFANLTAEDQAHIWKKLRTKMAQPAEAPASPPPEPAQPVTAKLLRVPAALELTKESSTASLRRFVGGELRAALVKASIFWVTVIAVGTSVLKIFAGG
jgi:hypothetical protein